MGPEPEDKPAILKKIESGLPEATSSPAPAPSEADKPKTGG